jgi:hypothetical protein
MPGRSTRLARHPILTEVEASPAATICPSCGTASGPDARFCLRCGTAVASRSVEPPAPAEDGPPPAAVELLLTPAGGTLAVGESVTFSVLERRAGGEVPLEAAPEWTVTDDGVLGVGNDGTVTALRVGTATLTATARTARASVMLHVTRVGVARLAITPPRHAMAVADEIQLQALAQDGFSCRLLGRVAIWSTSDPAVATVSRTGLLLAWSEGSVEIRVSIAGLSARAAIRVGPAVVASVRLAPLLVTLVHGETHHLRAAVLNALGRTIPGLETVWASSDPTVARVDQHGMVTGLRTGSVRVVAAVGGRRAMGTVDVMPRRGPGPPGPAAATRGPIPG